ncbi:C-type lectin domain family 2 member E-like [Peromyscus eremicus]|uniref:C-type lectin domain family 2 member E-like n=1 Tax=Peromyscus eremicus TaxID=42410 RepID=UPI0027DC67FB|nr:C-type lectin domain family 2 member E-like [Peromyscus eremicus]
MLLTPGSGSATRVPTPPNPHQLLRTHRRRLHTAAPKPWPTHRLPRPPPAPVHGRTAHSSRDTLPSLQSAISALPTLGFLSSSPAHAKGQVSSHRSEQKRKKLQVHCPSVLSPGSPAKLYGCYAVIVVLTAAVIALTVTLSEKEKKERVSIKNICAVCPKEWIGFRSKCFYFSEDMRNWTFSQTFCMAQEAHLARFDSLDELDFLMRYKGDSAHWIGLHRESTQHPWRWTDNTEYNNLVPIRGEGEHAYLSDRGISNGREHMPRKWICSKPDRYLQYPEVS